jgi:cysteine-rich repeat protein
MTSRLLLLLLLACGTTSQVSALSAFWTRAQQTKQLSELRVNPRTVKPTVNDSILTSPRFMPLCGNGKIDKRADYLAYYANTTNKALTLTKQQILSNNYMQLSEPDKLFNLSFIADEECDDGNRIDFDGCSADCMYLDLWAPACELAVDKSLEYEDIIYDTVRQRMVVSALDGIYSLEIAPGDSQITSRLLASKAFPVTSIFRHSGALILYSSSQQAFWQLLDATTTSPSAQAQATSNSTPTQSAQSKITFLRNLPNMTASSSDSEWRVILTPQADGPIIVRDGTSLLYLTSPNASAPAPCIVSAFPIANKRCSFLVQMPDNTTQVGCDHDRITIGPKNTCELFEGYDPSAYMEGTFWSDLFETASYKTVSVNLVDKMNYLTTPALQEAAGYPIMSLEAYHPMGGFLETTINPVRKFGSSAGNVLPIVYYKGEQSLLPMLMNSPSEKVCGADTCIFDNDPKYDAMEKNALKNAMGTTWNAILQEKINALSPPISNLYALKSDTARYRTFIDSLVKVYNDITVPLAISVLRKHPENNNLWALRKDKLVEVSKTGTLLTRSDGKCIPSGIALCNPCSWAANGQVCRPCSEKPTGGGNTDRETWAWSMSCPATCSLSAGRRLLLTSTEVTIQFALKRQANMTTQAMIIQRMWPTAVIDNNNAEGLTKLSVITSDVVGEMRRIKVQLLGLSEEDAVLVIPPYVATPIIISTPKTLETPITSDTPAVTHTTEADSKPTITTILILSLILVGVILMIIFAFIYNYKHSKALGGRGHHNQHPYHHISSGSSPMLRAQSLSLQL